MVQLPRAFLQEAEFRAAVDRVAHSLSPDVERIITTLEYDRDGELYADLLLIVSDDVGRRDEIHEVTTKARDLIFEQVDPLLEWGVWPLVSVRTHSGQAEMERRNVA